ncbi:uncharacterized protein I303_106390 [Kwoniella dejecticola CBS 10117]|uniref:F-box domain-containing protein n=1 Tax=Kwoniella dejecticola CBS 10117 TaxID=1296121 RepID=A0A1A5ZUU6_9TREE|nr:uncharacterized protein I303_08353 [Kwoniella dejecticola CBS 10117]OBR81582.1 hypothetical protein I303_08353 [Kwoniella dejecticola CBS 10117]
MSQAAVGLRSGCPISHNAASSTSPSISISTSNTPPPPANVASSSKASSESHPTNPFAASSGIASPATSCTTTPSTSSSIMYPVTPQLQSPLLRAPSEIIQKVLSASGGDQVGNIAKAAKVCRELRSIIYGDTDQTLWRDVFLEHYDDPRLAGSSPAGSSGIRIDWKKRVQDRELVGRVFSNDYEGSVDQLDKHSELIISTLFSMYSDLPPTNSSFDPSKSDDSLNSALLSKWLSSRLFKHIYESQYFLPASPRKPTTPLTRSGRSIKRDKRDTVDPIISRLHCLAPPLYNDDSSADREWRGHVRHSVYDVGNYQEKNDYGPFTEDGKVDWTLVDAISSTMMCNAQELLDTEPDGWLPVVQPLSYGIEPARGWGYNDLRRPDNLAEDDVWDWAGVEGSWCGCYAFMDYSDWAMMNREQLGIPVGRPHSIDLSTYHEALGDLMQLELKICTDPHADGKRSTRCDNHEFEQDRHPLPSVETDLPRSDLLPPLYFHGSSTPYPGGDHHAPTLPQNAIRGMVSLTADDPPQVRWTMMIRYRGQDRWRLECVQVGGRGSKRGFFGIWSDASRAEHSPNGPAWYWKA